MGLGSCPSLLTPSPECASHGMHQLEACAHKMCLQRLWLLCAWQVGVLGLGSLNG